MAKGIVAEIMKFSKGKAASPAAGPAGAPAEPDGDESGKTAAGTELADAIKSGDGARVASAFSAMMDLCKPGPMMGEGME